LRSFLLSLCCAISLCSSLAWAEDANILPGPIPKKTGAIYSFQLENDTTNIGGPGTDKAYTNGLKFSYGYADDRVPRWSRLLSSWSDVVTRDLAASNPSYNISLGQKIFTPKNLTLTVPNPDDQPYAAWLYLGFGANIKNGDHGHSVELDVGMVGPNALGEQAQNNLHRTIGIATAQGWDSQLKNEPTIELSFQERWRFLRIKNETDTLFDLIPYVGVAVGNVLDAAQAGGLFRFGYHLPDDLGPSRPSTLGSDAYVNPRRMDQADHKFGLYGFWGISGSAVAHSIFLDGNTFTSSAHVTRIPLIYNIEEGITMSLYGFYVSWKFITISPEFESRKETNSFASVQLTYSIPE
jgi:lipid A 3-O-deacylase